MAPSVSDPGHTDPMGTTPIGRVSVIICTKDRPADVARAVDLIRSSGAAGRAVEIVVVEEADRPRDIPGVRYVHLARQGRGFGYARNAGVLAARGETLVFVDDDCEVEPGWLENLTAPLEENRKILGVAGAVLVRGCGTLGYAESILGFPGGGLRYLHEADGDIVATRYLSTCNCAYRREAVIAAGGFAEDAVFGGEDFLISQQVATRGTCVYTPRAIVYHRPRGTLGAIFRWFVRRGKSEIALARRPTEGAAVVRYVLRSSWTLRFLLLVVLLVLWPQAALGLPVAAAGYYAAILWRFRFARTYAPYRRAWWLVPIVKLTMDAGAEWGRWAALLGDGRR